MRFLLPRWNCHHAALAGALVLGLLPAATRPAHAEPLPAWAFGPFVRPDGVNPLLPAQMGGTFVDPADGKPTAWEAGSVSDPGAVVREGKVCVFYTARPWQDSGRVTLETGAVGLAESADGTHFERQAAPVVYPANGEVGCRSPRVVEMPDGTFLMTYTQSGSGVASKTAADTVEPSSPQRTGPALAIATSRDLLHWDKRGPAFAATTGGLSHSGSIVCRLTDERLVAAKLDGKFWMYWSDGSIRLASSADGLSWTPMEDAGGHLATILAPRADSFDSRNLSPGPPAVWTERGIVLLYNCESDKSATGRCVGEALLDNASPGHLLERLPQPVLQAELPYEAGNDAGPDRFSLGAGNATASGLVYFQGRWLLYYGAGTGRAAVAVWDPTGRAVNAPAARKPKKPAAPDLLAVDADGCGLLRSGWEMIEAPATNAPPETISSPGLDTHAWFDAVVPGTVLSTLVEQGVEPDPLHGDNNLRISEKYCRQAYWYRRIFTLPANLRGRRLELGFDGINYAAEVWLNGARLGRVDGAFIRGRFDVSAGARFDGKNVLAVKILPQPNPGVPLEQSLGAGAGKNGGATMLDGPSFGCTVGWDWIPGIRDRCMGIWQDVAIHATGAVLLDDPHVTTLVPSLDRAEVAIEIAARNSSPTAQRGVLRGRLDGIEFQQPVSLEPNGSGAVKFSPASVPGLSIANPRLWWPNGAGNPDLHDLELSFAGEDGAVSNVRRLKVGLREMSYEMGGDSSMELIVKVNGRRIFCRGGNWGMDDAMKRLDPESMDARVRLHHDAHLNMIRNWVGQSTSEQFYALCDRYGIMVWNDFWLANPSDGPAAGNLDLFLDNARDTVLRFRNHPSIALWCARNESVPPSTLSTRLYQMVWRLDSSRLFIPDSASYGVSGHGPYNTIQPAAYFAMARGQKSELGLDSVPTADGMRAMLDERDRWPINDTWAYHDFCHADAMKADVYVDYLSRRYGDARGLDDFCRKAQLVNYESHRAAYEAWGQRMWRGASGLLLWMTNCSWPSTVWQLYDNDMEPTGALFGAQKACEPVHIQADPRDGTVTVVNSALEDLEKVTARAVVCDLQGRLLPEQSEVVDVAANSVRDCFKLPAPDLSRGSVRFVRLVLTGRDGTVLSRNFYWLSPKAEDLRALDGLPQVTLGATAEMSRRAGKPVVTVRLRNDSAQTALMVQLTLRRADGKRVLPVFYSENYCSLLPGESCEVGIEFSPSADAGNLQVEAAGWNVGKVLLPVRENAAP